VTVEADLAAAGATKVKAGDRRQVAAVERRERLLVAPGGGREQRRVVSVGRAHVGHSCERPRL
jgi:hypothetical protein